MAKILAFAGSARKDSVNKKLIAFATQKARDAGGDVTLVDLRDLPMPLYDGDLEEREGIPANAEKLYELMKSHAGLMLACPEYNSSITPLLKNAIDWVSRPRQGDPPLAAFQGKIAALLAASPGGLGGLRGLVHVRSILGNIGVIVLPTQVAIPAAFEKFDDGGAITDASTADKVKALATELVATMEKLA
jgi:NAD(P)H-dependent FMN reductase